MLVSILKARLDYIAFLRHAQSQPSAAATTIVERDCGGGHVTIVVPIGAAYDRTIMGDVIDAASPPSNVSLEIAPPY